MGRRFEPCSGLGRLVSRCLRFVDARAELCGSRATLSSVRRLSSQRAREAKEHVVHIVQAQGAFFALKCAYFLN